MYKIAFIYVKLFVTSMPYIDSVIASAIYTFVRVMVILYVYALV